VKRTDFIALLLAGVTLGTPGIILMSSAQEGAKRTLCATNLRSLYQSTFNYAIQYGGPHRLQPTDTGSDFWLRLKRTPKPLIEKTEVFFCPLADHDQTVDQTSFRGPATNINKMDDKDPVGADFDGNHGKDKGGNVLTKLGDVAPYGPEDPMWQAAEVKLSGTAPVKRQDPKSPAALEKRVEALEKAVRELTELVKELKQKLEKEGK
jgi:hypothetical protein